MARKIGIIGRGNVGGALSRALARAGYEVRATGKDPGEVREAGAWADLVILAVPYAAVDSAVAALGGSVAGKTVVDVVNPLTDDLGLAVGHTTSAAEELQRKLPAARVVKAFNTIFAQRMEEGGAGGEPLTAFAASDDARAKAEVLELARALRFDAVDAGPLAAARTLEPLAQLAIQLGYAQRMGTDIGMRLVHHAAP